MYYTDKIYCTTCENKAEKHKYIFTLEPRNGKPFGFTECMMTSQVNNMSAIDVPVK